MRTMTHRGGVTLLVCLALPLALPADDASTFIARYLKAEPALYERFVYNRKVVTRGKT
jgi:hypothetical protein